MPASHFSGIDVIVIGAGPAGSVSARELARRGYAVRIIEKAMMPRYKPCGGGVTAKAAALAGIDLAPISERRVSRAVMVRGGRRFEVAADGIGSMVMRADLDAALLRSAREAGADVSEGEAVTRVEELGDGVEVGTPATRLRARVAIAADGVESVAARQLGIRPAARIGVAIEAEIRPTTRAIDDVALFDFDAVPEGYGYVFPKRQHVSAGVFTARRAAAGLRQDLDRFLRARRLSDGERLSTVGHRVPLGRFGSRRWHTRRGVATGDAAGLADAFWGEGIYYAIKSGIIAAESIDEAFRRNRAAPDLSIYSRRLWAEIGENLRDAYWCSRLFYRLPSRVALALARHERTADTMMNVLRGEASYADFARAALRHAPAIVLDAIR